MRLYLLFAAEWYYPDGGWGDHRGTFDTLDEAIAKANELTHPSGKQRSLIDWWEVIELPSGRSVASRAKSNTSYATRWKEMVR